MDCKNETSPYSHDHGHDSESQVWASLPHGPNSYIWFSLWLPIVLEINLENRKEWDWCCFPRKWFLSSFHVCCVTFPGERWTSIHSLSIRPDDVWERWVQCTPSVWANEFVGVTYRNKDGGLLNSSVVDSEMAASSQGPIYHGWQLLGVRPSVTLPSLLYTSISQDSVQLGCRNQ